MLIEASVKHSVRQVCAKEGVTSLKPLLQHTHTHTPASTSFMQLSLDFELGFKRSENIF